MAAPRTTTDLVYGEVGGTELRLDLYLPPDPATDPAPLVVFLHGGAWAVGDKADKAATRAAVLAELGLSVASINYRLSDVATFPAQLHDAKGALRWLRANAGELQIDATRAGAFGPSAGGHLAALLGLTADRPDLEGDVGGNLDQSSAVQAVVDFYGPADLLATGSRTPLEASLSPRAFEAQLLGLSSVADDPDAARRASPRWHVHAEAPPFLLAHGDRDHVVALSESQALHDSLVAHGIESRLLVVGGAGHDDPRFDERATIELVAGFLHRHLDP